MKTVLVLGCLACFALVVSSEDLFTTTTTEVPSEEEEVVTPPPELEKRGIKVFTKVLGHSGKIMISSQDDFGADDTIVVQMASLAETGQPKGGNKGGKGSRQEFNKRKFNSFANQNFQFSPVDHDAQYPGTEYNVSMFNFTTDLRGKGQDGKMGELSLTVFVFQEDGNITVDNETTTFTAGTVKFNLELQKYSFCNTAEDAQCEGDGEGLNVEIEVKAKGGKKVEKAKQRKRGDDVDAYELGEGSAMRVSQKCEVDGKWTDLDTAPQFVQQGSKNILKLTLPKFSDKIVYDPTVDLSLEGLSDDSPNHSVVPKATFSLLAFLFVFKALLM